MRYLVVSDIHSNEPALEAVLQDTPPYDSVLCLGDLVGYGPNPNTCINRIRDLAATSIAGNHDWGAVGKADLRVFNREAQQALLWTRERLTPRNAAYLEALAPKKQLTAKVLLSHGSPRDPVWEYLVDVSTAMAVFTGYDFDICLVGHSHLPLCFEWREDQERVQPLRPEGDVLIHLEGRRLIVNPGSVGQPRDGNPEAAYALLDTDRMTWRFRRVSYAVQITQERMRAHGLPRRLIDRLEIGR